MASTPNGRRAETFTPPWHIGVDVGGTFTDLALIDAAGRRMTNKTLSRPDDPSVAVLENLRLTAERMAIPVRELLVGCRLFVHGLTVATNILLEQKGARVGLVTTAGFRDTLEIRRGIRRKPWDHRTPYPPVLVPRYLRRPVEERIDRHGAVHTQLNLDTVDAAADLFREEGVTSIAVSLVNSYLNPVHEQAVADRLRDRLPGVWISVSSDVAAIAGDYERQSTTVIDAYVAPRLEAYLSKLDRELRDLGLANPMLLVKNNGGTAVVSEVLRSPVALTLSGPAAVVGALEAVSAACGASDLISVEIGGTSTDVCLMSDGQVGIGDKLSIGDYDMAIPSVEVHTVGAGGGTIAGVDNAGGFFVGPAGAGADPGPACYGRGGTEPTVTDAHLLLGRLRAGGYAQGAIELDPDKAREAIERKLAEPLGLSAEEAAAGMIRLLEQRILHAVQSVSVQRGYDPRRFTFVAGGGAGGLHACSVARMLGCPSIYVPRIAGVMCAFGMLHSDVRQDNVRSQLMPFDADSIARIEEMFAEMRQQVAETLARQGFANGDMRFEAGLDLRYTGQQWDVRASAPVAGPFDRDAIRRQFENEYERQFGHSQPDAPMEIVKLRLTGFGNVKRAGMAELAQSTRQPEPTDFRPVFVDDLTETPDVPIYSGNQLDAGHELLGPAVIEEETTTVLVGRADRLTVDTFGNYVVALGAKEVRDAA